MKTEVLEEFVVLAKHLNFTAAAKELYVSQPRLSSHIKALEDELGFDLLLRNSTSLHLTPAGSVFLESAQKTLTVLQEGSKRAHEVATEKAPLAVYSMPLDSPYYKTLIKIKTPPIIFVDSPEEMTPFTALDRDLVELSIQFDYLGIEQMEKEAKAAGYEFVRAGYDKLTISVMDSHPIAKKKELTRDDIKGLKIMITSGAFYDSWQLLIEKTLGSDREFEFSLNQLRSLGNLAFLDMGDTAHVCSSTLINACFAGRDDVVTFDRLDGKEMLFADGFVFHQSNDRARELVNLIKANLPQE